MPDTMRILSRDAFAEVLGEALQRTRALDPARWSVLQQIEAQLEFMARETARGRVPHEEQRMKTSLGPLAVRELEDADPEYADQLEELDYTFRRYPLLPKGPPVRRRGVLQVWSGGDAFRKLVLELGLPRTVGTAGADFIANPDPAGDAAFQIVWDGVCAHIQALGSHTLTIGGEPAWYGEVANRGWLTAAGTTFRFFVEDRTPPPAPVTPSDATRAALAELRPHCDLGALYAVIDAARSERALELLEESVDPYASLYDGEQGRAFDDVAPYLVQLRRSSGLVDRLVHEGWGDAWGIYLTSDAGFDAVRRHLRQFLTVEAEGTSRRLLFRFYDPRVLAAFTNAIKPEQRDQLLDKLGFIAFEGPDARLYTLTHP